MHQHFLKKTTFKCLRFQVKSDSETNAMALEALLKQEKDKNREASNKNTQVSR